MKSMEIREEVIRADFENRMNEVMLEIYNERYNPKKIIDLLSFGGLLKIKNEKKWCEFIINIITLIPSLFVEMKPKMRKDYSKLKILGVRVIFMMIENFIKEQYINLDVEGLTDEDKRDIVLQSLLDWGYNYISSTVDMYRRQRFSNAYSRDLLN